MNTSWALKLFSWGVLCSFLEDQVDSLKNKCGFGIMETSPIWCLRLPRYFDPEDQTTLVACNVKVGIYSPPSSSFNISSQVAINMSIQLISKFVESRNISKPINLSQSLSASEVKGRNKSIKRGRGRGCHLIDLKVPKKKGISTVYPGWYLQCWAAEWTSGVAWLLLPGSRISLILFKTELL